MRESRHEVKTPDEINGQVDREISRMLMPQETAAPALPLDIVFRRLTKFDIARTLCQILRKDAICQEIECR
jgi:capsular polysaccharide biosynthesis protein